MIYCTYVTGSLGVYGLSVGKALLAQADLKKKEGDKWKKDPFLQTFSKLAKSQRNFIPR
jgi:hypothetical protein